MSTSCLRAKQSIVTKATLVWIFSTNIRIGAKAFVVNNIDKMSIYYVSSFIWWYLVLHIKLWYRDFYFKSNFIVLKSEVFNFFCTSLCSLVCKNPGEFSTKPWLNRMGYVVKDIPLDCWHIPVQTSVHYFNSYIALRSKKWKKII